MQAVLVRVGIDQTYGTMNAPVNPATLEFAYVPIPEDEGKTDKDGIKKKPIREVEGCKITYEQFKKACSKFDKNLPSSLLTEGKYAHLDPDFKYLTYGDESIKATQLRNLKLSEGDLLIFYSALEPINDDRSCHLCYAIIGFYEIKETKDATDIPPEQWKINAHSRREPKKGDDIVFIGKKGKSGRLSKCIPIGEYRPNEKGIYGYYLRKEPEYKWGGLTSLRLVLSYPIPRFKEPERFYNWLQREMESRKIDLKEENNLN